MTVEIGHLGAHHSTIHALADRLDRPLATVGGDRELLLGSCAAAPHMEADALQRQGLIEASSSPGLAAQACSQRQGEGGDPAEKAHHGCGHGWKRTIRMAP